MDTFGVKHIEAENIEILLSSGVTHDVSAYPQLLTSLLTDGVVDLFTSAVMSPIITLIGKLAVSKGYSTVTDPLINVMLRSLIIESEV